MLHNIRRLCVILAALVVLSASRTTVAGPVEVDSVYAYTAWGSVAQPFILYEYTEVAGPLTGSLTVTATLNELVDGPSYLPFTSRSLSTVQSYAHGLTGSMQAIWDATGTRNQGLGDRAHGSNSVSFTTMNESRLYFTYKANDDVFDVAVSKGTSTQTLHATAGRDATQPGSASGSVLLSPGTYQLYLQGIAYPGGSSAATNGFLSYVLDAVTPGDPLGSTPTNPVPSIPMDESDGKISIPGGDDGEEVDEGASIADNTTGAYLVDATNPGVIDPLYIGGALPVDDPGVPANVAGSYLYAITHDSFASVLLPDSVMGLSSFGIRYGLTYDSLTHSGVVTAGTPFAFSGFGDIRAFELYGFESLGFDATRPMPFVLGLKFTEPGSYVVYESAQSQAAAVPEPSSLVMIGIGACVAGAASSRRRRNGMK